ncbi:acyl-CoA thioesterase II [Mumia sp. zg.B53]|uniref:acyl-CoA thioesterase n=1 Tax=unclassified Mumia TaxID=2621872 RepID=UPI001C6E57DC|nr:MULTISPECIES: acyl-CoA thioesterase II [unclassified Mumia]MBW9205259.1 acyl-CoA thioesterase II [Mumia sp. zg.B17]MBW9208742.1 acyl-CoA thioesterase II [Mumia sp. zg.B21]MBW9213353.1 acyl-CoA thioesterase II [Mumia sp. zg.B53]MDD9350533.1 acyl-CoA thioesterase II [Mumia sp.]
MPATIEQLVDLLDLERLEEDLYRGTHPADSTLTRVFGGQVAAQALMAASHSVPEDRPVHSLHVYFLLGGDPSVPIIYDVERIRDGGSFSTRRVSARQHGKVIFYMTASFHRREDGYEHQNAIPEVPPVESTPVLSEVLEFVDPRAAEHWRAEWSALEVRYVGDNRAADDPARGLAPSIQRLWLRAAGDLPDDPVLNACVLTYISDLTLLGSSLVVHGLTVGSPRIQPASLDHAVWFHRPVRADQWMLYDQVSPSAIGARGFATANIFAEDGALVASVAQEGLIRPIEPRPQA